MRDWCQIKQQEKVLAWPMCRLYRTGSKTDWKKLMTRKQVELVRKLCCARLRECEPIFRDEQFLKSYPNKEGIEEEVLAPRFPWLENNVVSKTRLRKTKCFVEFQFIDNLANIFWLVKTMPLIDLSLLALYEFVMVHFSIDHDSNHTLNFGLW